MATSRNDEIYLLTQPLINSNAKTDAQPFLQSNTMNSSRKEEEEKKEFNIHFRLK